MVSRNSSCLLHSPFSLKSDIQYLSRDMIGNGSAIILSGHQLKSLELLSLNYKLLEERTTQFSLLRLGVYHCFHYLQPVSCSTTHFAGIVKTSSPRSRCEKLLSGDVDLGRKWFQFLTVCVCVCVCVCVYKTSKVNLYISFNILKNTILLCLSAFRIWFWN